MNQVFICMKANLSLNEKEICSQMDTALFSRSPEPFFPDSPRESLGQDHGAGRL